MRPEEGLLAVAGTTVPLLGNEALARGLLEGGLELATAYPGTPSTEIMESLMRAARAWEETKGAAGAGEAARSDEGVDTQGREGLGTRRRLHAEWSVNEKVAAEVAIAGSMSGLRTATAMKGVGLNVASEPLQAYTYMGVRGGLVVVVADDPGLHSSHTEQDNRLLARQAYLPVLEPASPQEAREMAAAAFALSEAWGQPVVLRTTTRVAHTRADVTLGPLPPPPVNRAGEQGRFQHDPPRWVNLPANARRMRLKLIERLQAVEGAVSELPFNRYEGPSAAKRVVIACGAPYGPVKEALAELGLTDEIGLVKVATPYPLPVKLLERALKGAAAALVVEELEPFVEQAVAALAHQRGLKAQVVGKELLPLAGELSTEQVLEALEVFSGVSAGSPSVRSQPEKTRLAELVRPRPPTLCAGCGHRALFYALGVVERRLKRQGQPLLIKPSDIGCYTLGYNPPLSGVDAHLCMGASLGMAAGFAAANRLVGDLEKSEAGGSPVVCTIGDSTFFHAGLPPLAHAAATGANLTVVILDNNTTAMTGHQPHPGATPPGTKTAGQAGNAIPIEGAVRGLGIEWVRTVDAEDLTAIVAALEEAVCAPTGGTRTGTASLGQTIAHPGPAVIIARSPCAVLEMRAALTAGGLPTPYTIDQDRCVNCGACIDRFGCPAIVRPEAPAGLKARARAAKAAPKPVILAAHCSACGVCAHQLVCPVEAIMPAEPAPAPEAKP